MIPVAAGARIWWIASGRTDMRKVTNGLALLMQEGLGRDPLAGDVFVFRDRAGSLIKALWHDNDDGETRRGPQAPGQQNAATDSRTLFVLALQLCTACLQVARNELATDRQPSIGRQLGTPPLGDVPSLRQVTALAAHGLDQSSQQCCLGAIARMQQCRTTRVEIETRRRSHVGG